MTPKDTPKNKYDDIDYRLQHFESNFLKKINRWTLSKMLCFQS